MNPRRVSVTDLIVVDENCDEYLALAMALRADDVRVRLFVTGTDALRAIRTSPSMVWIINIRLPDMSGICFLELIKRRVRQSRVILVGDHYSAEDEVAARSAGATAYVCKPPSVAWFGAYQPQHSPAVPRQIDTLHGSAAAMHPP
jgi:DNA-binding NtrC family response regulator